MALKHDASSELSIDDFYGYKIHNMDVLPELEDFYKYCCSLNTNKNTIKVTADSNNEWKKHEAKNWLTENKKNRDDDEKLYSSLRSILNKLSDDNFNVLIDEIKKLNINEEII
jgi:hypothetical protein